jgi:hypothetical protein
MKFQKYLDAARQATDELRHLDYGALKVEVKRLADSVKSGDTACNVAALSFAKKLELELTEVGCHWEVSLWSLRSQVNALCTATSTVLNAGATKPMVLLDPLCEWLRIAALADALRRHRLLQITAVVKIIKKFVKMVQTEPRKGFTAADLLGRSALSSALLHELCTRLENFGDMLLQMGLAPAQTQTAIDSCPICLGSLNDPARLPCSHRMCIHCILPLFDNIPDEESAVLLRCPLCRAAGPQVPQALCLDTLLGQFGRGLSPAFGIDTNTNLEETQQFTAVVVSSLARLAMRNSTSNDSLKDSMADCSIICSERAPVIQPPKNCVEKGDAQTHLSP